MNLELAKQYESRALGVVDEHGQYFESLDALAAWEKYVQERLAKATADIAAGRTYNIADALKIIDCKLGNADGL